MDLVVSIGGQDTSSRARLVAAIGAVPRFGYGTDHSAAMHRHETVSIDVTDTTLTVHFDGGVGKFITRGHGPPREVDQSPSTTQGRTDLRWSLMAFAKEPSRFGETQRTVWPAADYVGVGLVLTVVFPPTSRADQVPASLAQGHFTAARAGVGAALRPRDHRAAFERLHVPFEQQLVTSAPFRVVSTRSGLGHVPSIQAGTSTHRPRKVESHV